MVTEVISTDLLQKKNNKKKLSYGHRGYQHRLTAEKK